MRGIQTWLAPSLALSLCLLPAGARAAEFTLESADFAPGATLGSAHVFKGFGCTGGNLSPALHWSHPPAGTRSFALLVHDPDAPTGGSGWWHWVVLNIPATTRSLPAGAGAPSGAGLPPGTVQIRTDYGTPGWGGPCPPRGDRPHRYVFTLHALNTPRLAVAPDASAALAGYLVNASSIGKATLIGRYGR